MSEEEEKVNRCWYCGGKLIWQNDFAYSDIYGAGEGIVTYLTCSECGAEVEYSRRDDVDENGEPLEDTSV